MTELQTKHAGSRWLDDAKALALQVKQQAGTPISPEDETNEDMKILAINGLMQSDPERGYPLLEGILALAPDDASTAAELARLYQLNGEGVDARRVLRRALVYNPDDVRLWELSVKTAKDLADEETAQCEIVRRFPDEPKHSLDLAAILINRDKYDEARELLSKLTKPSSSTTIKPSRSSGANTAERVPMTTSTSPRRIRCH